jgi:hypothetical protein
MIETTPAVQHIQQPQSKLCWATCILMARTVVKGANADITPEKISSRSFYTSQSNIGGFDHVTTSVIEDWIGKSLLVNSITYSTVRTYINNNKPILLGYSWLGGGGHVMIIGGYEDKGADWGLVKLFDPLQTAPKIISFDRINKGDYDPDSAIGHQGHKLDCAWLLS